MRAEIRPRLHERVERSLPVAAELLGRDEREEERGIGPGSARELGHLVVPLAELRVGRVGGLPLHALRVADDAGEARSDLTGERVPLYLDEEVAVEGWQRRSAVAPQCALVAGFGLGDRGRGRRDGRHLAARREGERGDEQQRRHGDHHHRRAEQRSSPSDAEATGADRHLEQLVAGDRHRERRCRAHGEQRDAVEAGAVLIEPERDRPVPEVHAVGDEPEADERPQLEHTGDRVATGLRRREQHQHHRDARSGRTRPRRASSTRRRATARRRPGRPPRRTPTRSAAAASVGRRPAHPR